MTQQNIGNASIAADEVNPYCSDLDIFFSNADVDTLSRIDAILCFVNAVFSFVAVFANGIILYALYKASSLNSTSKALLCSLALSDMGIGAIVQPLFVVYRWAYIRHGLEDDACIAGFIAHVTGSGLAAVSFLTMTAISVDRLLALHLRMKYQAIITLRRTCLALAFIWSLGCLSGVSWKRDQREHSLSSIICIPICFVVSFLCYFKIYRVLRKQGCKMAGHVNLLKGKGKITEMNLSRYKKSVLSMFYLFCAFLISFLPYFCLKLAVVMSSWNTATSVLFSISLTMVYLNSSLNPLIYCWRITELKQIVLQTLCQLFSIIRGFSFKPVLV